MSASTCLSLGAIDPAKVQSVVCRCTLEGVDERNSLSIVTEVANRYGIELSPEEESEAANELLQLSQQAQ